MPFQRLVGLGFYHGNRRIFGPAGPEMPTLHAWHQGLGLLSWLEAVNRPVGNSGRRRMLGIVAMCKTRVTRSATWLEISERPVLETAGASAGRRPPAGLRGVWRSGRASPLYFHGHPGSRLEARFVAEAAVRAGVRLIGVDRPGLGLSDYQPRRRVADWPDDVVQLVNQLRLQRVAVLGCSGGAPYALVCANRLADRVTACAIVSGASEVGLLNVGPLDAVAAASPHTATVRR